MALSNTARTRKIASYKPMAFRRADEPRPFRRGDLALVLRGDASLVGQVAVVCQSDRGNDGNEANIAVQFTRGGIGPVRAGDLQLIAAVDAHEYGPACDDLLNFIAGNGPLGLADFQ